MRKTDTESVLVFTRTKYHTQRVAQQLKNAGFKATSLQGNLAQPQRQAALDGFRAGSFDVLVATNIAARGIDVSRDFTRHKLPDARQYRRLYSSHWPRLDKLVKLATHSHL